MRKALEAGLTAEFSFTLTPKRILELYLNYAQFCPNLYGICAASSTKEAASAFPCQSFEHMFYTCLRDQVRLP
ncbi:hypothetical protein [Pseudarthrobacter sp. CC4]|uniref:hypothetical protein n=1 Tax=Pseudarthrobacter sp. CC4 TaxID=3029190 RepID=UPI003BA173BA